MVLFYVWIFILRWLFIGVLWSKMGKSEWLVFCGFVFLFVLVDVVGEGGSCVWRVRGEVGEVENEVRKVEVLGECIGFGVIFEWILESVGLR